MAKLHSGLAEPNERYLVLLLTAPGNVSAHRFNANASFYWNRFWTSANRYWPGLSYWKVAELQQRGHVHFHVIVRGIDFIEIERFRSLAVRSGFGSFVGVARPSDYPGGVKGAAGYLSKYLLKQYQAVGDGGPRFVTMSRDWPTLWREPVKRPNRSSWLTYYDLRRLKMLAQKPPAPPSRTFVHRAGGAPEARTSKSTKSLTAPLWPGSSDPGGPRPPVFTHSQDGMPED